MSTTARDGDTEATRWIERYERLGDARCRRGRRRLRGSPNRPCTPTRDAAGRSLLDGDALLSAATSGTLGFSDSCRDVPGSVHEIDPQSIYDYLYLHVIPAPQTVFRDVRRVEHAHRVIADSNGVQSQPYWTPAIRGRQPPTTWPAASESSLTPSRKSVADEADDPSVACFLSGGTDSSTVAGMLARVRKEPVHCFSIGFESEGYDEMEYARIAARHFGLVHHEYYVTPDDLVSAIPKVAASFDQPFGNSSVLPAYYCGLPRHAKVASPACSQATAAMNCTAATRATRRRKLFELYHSLPEWLRHSVLEPPATDLATCFARFPAFARQVDTFAIRASPCPTAWRHSICYIGWV